jgi:hypothetical protein
LRRIEPACGLAVNELRGAVGEFAANSHMALEKKQPYESNGHPIEQGFDRTDSDSPKEIR